MRYLLIPLFFIMSFSASGQNDIDPPVTPLFNFVTVNPVNGLAEMTWSLSPSSDVAGYVVYRFRNGEGFAIDTIFNPAATSFTDPNPGPGSLVVTYVVAAIDSSGNISPLSNPLNTILAASISDSCNMQLDVSWNKYASFPSKVTGYDIFASVNSGAYYLAGHVTENVTSFSINDFVNGSRYCFIIKAVLENGRVSGSNVSCSTARIQKPPAWINADFASIDESGKISVAFTVDPASEIHTFRLERRSGPTGTFQQVGQLITGSGKIIVTDNVADKASINFYRLSAINSCGNIACTSNLSSNIVINYKNTGGAIILSWNKYKKWVGQTESYSVYSNTGSGFTLSKLLGAADSTYSINIPEIMYGRTSDSVCFYVKASETGNPYGVSGESVSNVVCSSIDEVITVPDIFTPDGDMKNDLFRPVITFTPVTYKLVVGDRNGRVLFETSDFLETWDGSSAGKPVPEGVYLWFIRLKNRNGKNISRTGTVTLIRK